MSLATRRVLGDDGWLHTGDLGSIDEHGYCRVQGRLKDMIIRGGENVYPREVEDVLFEHEAVEGVAVVGVPDPEWGESAVAFIQLKPGHEADGHALAAEIAGRGGQALPLAVDIRDDSAIEAAVGAAVRHFGSIDVLVNNASAINPSKTPDLPMSRFDLMFDTNVRGTFAATEACHTWRRPGTPMS